MSQWAARSQGRRAAGSIVANRRRHEGVGRVPQLEGRGVDGRRIHRLAEDRRHDRARRNSGCTGNRALGRYRWGRRVGTRAGGERHVDPVVARLVGVGRKGTAGAVRVYAVSTADPVP